MPAFVALKDANFGTVLFDRIRRASSQMSIAAAFDAAKRSNKLLFLDDEGTIFHSPAPNPRRSGLMQSDKGREIWTVPKIPCEKLCKRSMRWHGNRCPAGESGRKSNEDKGFGAGAALWSHYRKPTQAC